MDFDDKSLKKLKRHLYPWLTWILSCGGVRELLEWLCKSWPWYFSRLRLVCRYVIWPTCNVSVRTFGWEVLPRKRNLEREGQLHHLYPGYKRQDGRQWENSSAQSGKSQPYLSWYCWLIVWLSETRIQLQAQLQLHRITAFIYLSGFAVSNLFMVTAILVFVRFKWVSQSVTDQADKVDFPFSWHSA